MARPLKADCWLGKVVIYDNRIPLARLPKGWLPVLKHRCIYNNHIPLAIMLKTAGSILRTDTPLARPLKVDCWSGNTYAYTHYKHIMYTNVQYYQDKNSNKCKNILSSSVAITNWQAVNSHPISHMYLLSASWHPFLILALFPVF